MERQTRLTAVTRHLDHNLKPSCELFSPARMDRRKLRTRKVSQKMGVVDAAERKQVSSLTPAPSLHRRHTRRALSHPPSLPPSPHIQAMAARLEALESDAAQQDTFAVGNSDDEEFILRDDSEEDEEEGGGGGKRRKKKARVDGGMRKTRGMIADKARGPKGFRDWLDEAALDQLPEGEPSYLTAAVGPPRTRSARPLCSVCGDFCEYTCTRCGSRYCSIRCSTVHTETRCLKFIA